MRRVVATLFAAILCLGAACACSTEPRAFPEWPTPVPREAQLVPSPGWEDLEIHAVCLTVDKQYEFGPNWQGPLEAKRDKFEPLQDATQGFLEQLGLEVMPSRAECDASLVVRATFAPLFAQYRSLGRCATGATLELEVALSAPGRPELRWQEATRKDPPQVVTYQEGNKKCAGAEDAPYGNLWYLPLSGALLEAFGDDAYCPMLLQVRSRALAPGAPNFDLDEAAVAVPCLIQLLQEPDASLRERAGRYLGMLEHRANAAVPYLLQIRLDEEEPGDVRAAARRALERITGVGRKTEERSDGHSYSVAWSEREWIKWWNEQDPAAWND